MKVILIMTSINAVLLTAWSIVDRFVWTRRYTQKDLEITNVVGYCLPKTDMGFYLLLLLILF